MLNILNSKKKKSFFLVILLQQDDQPPWSDSLELGRSPNKMLVLIQLRSIKNLGKCNHQSLVHLC